MAIVPSQELLAKLRAGRFANAGPAHVREAVTEDDVYLGGTIGVCWFLTPDGRVLEVPDEDPGPPVVHEKHGDDAAWILVDAAWRLGVPELFDLLPPAPADATTCNACRGSHYVQLDAARGPDNDRTFACYECHGRGWRIA